MKFCVPNFRAGGECPHTSYYGWSPTFPQSSVEARPSAPRPAFTLIELLVVIAIIAVLAAMLLGALSKSKQQAQVIVCKNHLHEMGLAMRMYVDEFSAYPYYCGWGIENLDQEGATLNIEWPLELQRYYPLDWTNASYHCPAYTGQIQKNENVWWGSYSYNVWGTSVPSATPNILNEFGVLNDFGLGVGIATVTANDGMSLPPRKESQVLAPSEMFCMMDSRGSTTNLATLTGYAGVDWTACIPTIPNKESPFGQGMYFRYLQNPPQHGNNFNVACCDGHVESLRLSYLFNPTNTAPRWNFDHQPHPELWGFLQ